MEEGAEDGEGKEKMKEEVPVPQLVDDIVDAPEDGTYCSRKQGSFLDST